MDRNSVEEAAALVGKEAGDSGRKVQRYIRLTLLIAELLQLVDKGQIKVLSAVSLSFLSEDEQRWVLDCTVNQRASITGSSAEKLKKYHENEKLTQLAVELILLSEKKEPVKVTLSEKRIRQYFPKEYGKEQIESIIISLLEQWKSEQHE